MGRKRLFSTPSRTRSAKRRRTGGRWKPRLNKLSTRVKGHPNSIYVVRTLDAGMIDFGKDYDTHDFLGTPVKYGRKAWNESTSAKSFAVINFPNFEVSWLPKLSDFSALFGRYKVMFVAIKLQPAYKVTTGIEMGDTPSDTPGNTMANYLVTRLSSKYDTFTNSDRFDNTYGEEDTLVLDQLVKKKTVNMSTDRVKGWTAFTKKPRQLMPVIADINADNPTEGLNIINVKGKWNDFDDGGSNTTYMCNDCIVIRSTDLEREIPKDSVLKYRVIYKVGLKLSGFQ